MPTFALNLVLPSGGARLLPFNRPTAPRLRLFCFPYAGGDANLFREWAAHLPAAVQVIGVQYPGRGANSASAAVDNCSDMVAGLHAVMAPWLDTDFAFFGHSNGALISFELARRLSCNEVGRQRHHFLSARVAAHTATGRPKISALPHKEFVRELRNMGGTPAAVLQDSHLMNLIAPRLRADFALGDNYAYRPGPALACDISTLHGVDDHLVDGQLVQRWAELTRGGAQHHLIPGDHFFLNSRRADVLAIVRSKLLDSMSSEPVAP